MMVTAMHLHILYHLTKEFGTFFFFASAVSTTLRVNVSYLFDSIYALREFHECVPANHQSNFAKALTFVLNAHHLTHPFFNNKFLQYRGCLYGTAV